MFTIPIRIESYLMRYGVKLYPIMKVPNFP